MPKDEEHTNNIKQSDVRDREREETFSQNYTAQTKLEVSQPVSQTDSDRKASLQSAHKENREKKRSQCVHSTPAEEPVGMLD